MNSFFHLIDFRDQLLFLAASNIIMVVTALGK